MKLILLGLGVVAGIYISWTFPDAAVQIFNGFLELVNWLSAAMTSMLRGGQ
ncbi:hypothetical protein [Shewanella morhuae]|uniref:Uncharacterized protein n=1 Tax=Shewanella morhuae TaxID=365591 RepID=A0A380BRY8_9GAMM|nr:hypothetical protein [Shewanella morhuae]SUJ05490.1 Uncharacterised protein [Shewanella morhuae]SUJ07218.1 Uncharacterised protein [Shewanella morhuae]